MIDEEEARGGGTVVEAVQDEAEDEDVVEAANGVVDPAVT